MRKTIARCLNEFKQTVSYFYLTARCNLGPLLKLRSELNASLVPRGIKLSVNDFMIKALAKALTVVPQFGDDAPHRFSLADISMAVIIDRGFLCRLFGMRLHSPCPLLQSRALASKARDGKLEPGDYADGTAPISDLGMFCIDEMFPVISPAQALNLVSIR